jgi:hypothetical protein
MIRTSIYGICKRPAWIGFTAEPGNLISALWIAMELWGEPIVWDDRIISAARLATPQDRLEYILFHGWAGVLTFKPSGPVGDIPVT